VRAINLLHGYNCIVTPPAAAAAAALCFCHIQVWNANPVVGIVGVFNLQGSSWDRNRRKFHVHDKRGQTLTTRITPADVETFRHPAAAAAAGDSDGAAAADVSGSSSSRWAGAAAAAGVDGGAATQQTPQQQQQQQLFAVYQYGTEELAVVPSSGSVSVALSPSGSDLVWVSPLQVCDAVSFAPIGLIDMFNGGGAITSFTLAPAHAPALSAAAAAGSGVLASSSSSRASSSSPVVAAAAATANGAPAAVAALQLKGCGRFLAYSSVRPSRVLLNLTPHNFSWDEFTNRLEFEVPQLEGLQCEVQVLFQ
jgi:raffinose synthase